MNWMRLIEPPIERASALASMVLPTPGTSSMSRCPSATSTVRAIEAASGLPSMTVCTEVSTLSAALRSALSIAVIPLSQTDSWFLTVARCGNHNRPV